MELEIVDSVGSTSDALKARAAAGGPEQALMARHQTAGRGRYGRSWATRDGNLHLSVLLRPADLRFVGHWSLLAAVALADAIGATSPTAAGLRLKWPNDVMLDGAKLAGILLEADSDAWLVIGFGVNVAAAPDGLGRPIATLAGCGAATAEELARATLACLGAWRRRYAAAGFTPVRDAWLALGPPPGAALALSDGRTGRFAGLADDGALLLESDGAVAAIVSGEVAIER